MIDYVNLRSKLKHFSNVSTCGEIFWSDLNELVLQTLVPEKTVIESRPFERQDFTDIPDVSKLAFQVLKSILLERNDDPSENNDCFLKVIYSSIILCGEHSGEFLWSNDECNKLSQVLVGLILEKFRCENIDNFFIQMDHRNNYRGNNILSQILPKLSKDSWKYHPATVQCYSWLIYRVKMPHMKYFIHRCLPFSLNILADYEIDSKIIGLNCLTHMISNVSKAELNWSIQLEVLHNILKPLFYYREGELILPLIKCTIEVADKSSSRFKDAGVDLEWSFFDEILSIILPMMEYEQDMQRRLSYVQSLCIIMEHSNLAIGRWSQRILQIIEDYAKIYSTELEAVMALKSFTEKCWPLITYHWRYVNLISGKIIYQSNNDKAIAESKIILNMLKKLLPDEKGLVDVDCIEAKRRGG